MANENLILDIKVNSGNTTEELNKVTKSVKGVEAAVASTTAETVTLKDTLQFGRAIIGGIAAVKGAMIGLGMENNTVIKSLTQIMALQQTYTGVMQVINTLSSQNLIITQAKTAAMWLYNAALKASAATMAAITGGVTLLIAGMGALLTWVVNNRKEQNELATATKTANKELENQRKQIEKNLTQARREDAIKEIEARISRLKAEGASVGDVQRAEGQLRDLRKVIATEDMAEIKKVRDFRLGVVEELNKVIAATEQQLQNQTNTGVKSSLKIQLADLQNAKNEELTILHETNAKISALEIAKNTETIAGNKVVADNNKKLFDEQQKQLEELYRKRAEDADLREQIGQTIYEATTSAEQREIDAVEAKYAALRFHAERFGMDMVGLQTALEAELGDIRQRAIDKELAENEKKNQKKLADDAEAAKKKKELNTAIFQAERILTNGIIDLTEAMSDESEKAVKINKTMALLQIMIDTATAISQATAKNVTTDPVSTAIKIATTIGVVMANIAKARQILNSVNVGGGEVATGEGYAPRGVSTYGAGAIAPPPQGNGTTNTTATSAQNGGAQKVYVTETDIRAALEGASFTTKVATI